MSRFKMMLAGLAGGATLLAGPAIARESTATRLMVVLTTPDPQTQFMAFTLIASSGIEPATVRVLLCGPGGDMALRDTTDAPAPRFGPDQVTVQSRLIDLGAKGATLEVCAIYLPSRGSDRTALIESVGVARPAEIGPILVAPDVHVLTF